LSDAAPAAELNPTKGEKNLSLNNFAETARCAFFANFNGWQNLFLKPLRPFIFSGLASTNVL
jgi:hypothetical protein